MQYKKDTVKEQIDNAAITVFTQKGYLNTKIADIAKESGVSVGNIYRYYSGKEVIFYSLVSPEFINSLNKTLFDKIVGWKQRDHHDKENLQADQRFIEFILKNRSPFLILLEGCKGTKYENFKSEITGHLTALFTEHYQSNVSTGMLRLIYEKYIELFSAVLRNARDEQELIAGLTVLNQYHMYGITDLIL